MPLLALAALAFSGLLASAAAQERDAGLPLWEAGVFAGAASTPAYPASADRAALALVVPVVVYRGEVFRADREGVGAWLYRSDNLEFDLGFAGSLPSKSDDSAVRKGMPDLGTLVEFGPRLNLTLARPAPNHRVQFEFPVRAALELGGGVRRQGYTVEPKLSYEIRDRSRGWDLTASAGVVWGDSEINNFFYGVSPAYATATRPAYAAQQGLIATRLGLRSSKEITPDLRIYGFVRQEFFDAGANQASPLYQQPTGTSAGLGLVWMLGRSEKKVPL